MKILLAFLFLPFTYFAQVPVYGAYIGASNDKIFDGVQIIDYGTHDGELNPPLSVRYALVDYRAVYNKSKKCYEISYDKKVIYSFQFGTEEKPTIYWTEAGQTDVNVFELFAEQEEPYLDGEVYDENTDKESVNNSNHVQYFNKDKNSDLPHELTFYDFSNIQRITDMLDNGEEIPATNGQQVVAMGEFENASYENTQFYLMFNEKEQLYDLFSSENSLLYKVKLLEDSKYLEFFAAATNKNLGKMRLLDMESTEGAPPDILIIGEYHLEDGTSLELRMQDDVNSEQLLVYYPTSKYGKEFLIIDQFSDKSYCTLPKDEKKYYYEIIFDEDQSGVFHLIDLKTKEKVTARYDF